jgi:hypothetical protein
MIIEKAAERAKCNARCIVLRAKQISTIGLSYFQSGLPEAIHPPLNPFNATSAAIKQLRLVLFSLHP